MTDIRTKPINSISQNNNMPDHVWLGKVMSNDRKDNETQMEKAA